MPVILGIDPGLCGAAALFNTAAPGQVDVLDLPTVGESTKRTLDVGPLSRWFAEMGHIDHAFIEYVTAMQEWGSGSSFRFGMSFGALRATVELARIPYTLVVPVKWKKFYTLKGGDKESARQRAIQLFPGSADLFARKKDHQRAEASLIARYGASTQLSLVA